VSGEAWIDGARYPLAENETVYDFVTRHRGRDAIPVLCHEPALQPFGACRLCSVEVAFAADGPRRVVASCHTPAAAGQHIHTDSPRVQRLRRHLLELVLSAYPATEDRPAPGHRPTELQALFARYGVTTSRFGRHAVAADTDRSHPYLRFDASQCIHCHRCIRACDEVQGSFVLAMHGRGHESRVIRALDQDFRDSDCVSCGRCVQSCPTNALSDRHQAKTLEADRTVPTTCTYCGVGCNLEVLVQGGAIRAIRGADGAVNHGHTCVKGRYAFEYYRHPDRLRTPLIRRDGALRAATWDEALDLIANRFAEIRAAHGADAIAGISSARCTNEENYLMQKLMRAVVGTNNIDGCARVCHAPTAFGMQQTFGTGAATNSIDEIPLADCLLVIGANPSEAHPVTGAKIRQRAMQGVPLILIDPRAIELAPYAAVHLQPRPGTNVALINLLARELIDQGLTDDDFIARRTEGFAAFRSAVLAENPDRLAAICGCDRAAVREAARLYGEAERAMAFHGLGVTEHYQGSKAIMLLTALALMTGQVGRPGTGINPLRGQNNVQGAADMGVQPHQGAGYLDVRDPEVRAHYARVYGREVPGEVGLRIPEMFAAAREGRLKALWVMGEDLLQTDPNSCEVRYSLSRLDVLVVQELFMTETAAIAHVVLPAASHFEKSGTFTNGERRIQRVNRVVDPLPGTLPDGQIVVEVMRRLGYPQPDYDAAALLEEIAEAVPFFAGVRWNRLDDDGLQWPVLPDGTDTQILHRDAFKRGKGRFLHFPFVETPELAGDHADYPYILTTGRVLAHYNCGTMTRRTPNRELADRDVLLIHPRDAAAHGIADDDRVEVRSRRGATHLCARLSEQVRPGVLFTTFHFPEVAINHLTSGIFDQDSMTPEYKVVAVGIARAV
jgi:formate dehydrogenase major subunit